MYIDALNGKTVTRETLLRYTLKSYSVNDLIRGRLWETLGGGLTQLGSLPATISGEGHLGIAVLTCSRGSQYRHGFLPTWPFEAGFRHWRALFRHSRP